MKAALIRISGFGTQTYIITGENAYNILDGIQDVQDLRCLINMGRYEEDDDGQKQLDLLEATLDKYDSNKLTMQDINDLNIVLSIGSLNCIEIAEDDDAVESLKQRNPKVLIR